jgi:CheY-like chemotaxis protein
MLHELTTNANKYGALSASTGVVEVEWAVRDGGLDLTWVERDGPPVQRPSRVGFGTTLIQQTAKADGGEAVVEYHEKGVTWQIKVPLPGNDSSNGFDIAPMIPKSAAKIRASISSPVLSGKRILVIEDEPLIALEIVSCLEMACAEVAGPAGTTIEALEIIANTQLDAAFLDGNLQGQSVDTVAAALTRRSIPFVFVTGYGRESLPVDFHKIEVLGKPFTTEQLLDAASGLVERALQRELNASN